MIEILLPGHKQLMTACVSCLWDKAPPSGYHGAHQPMTYTTKLYDNKHPVNILTEEIYDTN